MADGSFTVLDGSHLRAIDPSLPESDETLTGAQVLELAESRASSSLFGLALPEALKSSALKRLDLDAVSFRCTKLDQAQASSKVTDYITAIADELRDDPLVAAVLDGKTLQLVLEDEDDFAMLAENLFTDLDTEDKGKIRKSEMQAAVGYIGLEMGIPPFAEYPLLNDILKKHGAEGEEELGQAQFAQLLQHVLQELADSLARKHFVVVVQNIKIMNGSKLRKLLTNEKELSNVLEKILQVKHNEDDLESLEIIRSFLEKNEEELGLPPLKADDAVVLLYETVFTEVEKGKSEFEPESDDEFIELVKEILDKFAEQLEANPVFHDLDS